MCRVYTENICWGSVTNLKVIYIQLYEREHSNQNFTRNEMRTFKWQCAYELKKSKFGQLTNSVCLLKIDKYPASSSKKFTFNNRVTLVAAT